MNKEGKTQKTIFIYTEEFKTESFTNKENLKEIFNVKLYNYIKKKENKIFGSCNEN